MKHSISSRRDCRKSSKSLSASERQSCPANSVALLIVGLWFPHDQDMGKEPVGLASRKNTVLRLRPKYRVASWPQRARRNIDGVNACRAARGQDERADLDERRRGRVGTVGLRRRRRSMACRQLPRRSWKLAAKLGSSNAATKTGTAGKPSASPRSNARCALHRVAVASVFQHGMNIAAGKEEGRVVRTLTTAAASPAPKA